jgi:hypothetical protein
MALGQIPVSGSGVGTPGANASGFAPANPLSAIPLFAQLPQSAPIGNTQYTSDQGLCIWTGVAWVPVSNAVSPLTFGADPTGVKDSTVAIQAADTAATAAGKYLYFPPGTYSISIPVGANASAILGGGASWFGSSRDSAILKSAAGTYQPGQRMVSWSNLANFEVEHLGFDMSLASCAGSNGNVCYVILPFQSTDWAIRDVSVKGLSNYMLGIYPNDTNAGTNWAITDCYFLNSVPSIHQSQAINVQQSGVANQHQISRNVCIGTGIFTNAANGLYNDNIVSGWSFGSGITVGPNAACLKNRIVGNYCFSSGIVADDNGTIPFGIENWAPYTQVVGNYCASCGSAGLLLAGTGSTVVGNIFLNNNQAGGLHGGISAYSTANGTATNSIIDGNICTDNQGTKTQTYGYIEFGSVGTITGVIVGVHNQFNGNLTGTTSFRTGSPGVLINHGGFLLQSDAVPTIVSAATIAPTTRVSAVNGSAAISTITPPPNWPNTAACSIDLLPLAASTWTTATGGNIALASVAVVRRTLTMTFDPAAGLWFPSY